MVQQTEDASIKPEIGSDDDDDDSYTPSSKKRKYDDAMDGSSSPIGSEIVDLAQAEYEDEMAA